ncbi:MAG: CGNR zinc finger domain-containing protein [Vagococcus sp.]|uniref:CGNR zinc finger domain-containing protein n=1 Tax=Vagococcus sp. TaxID=1933889 RepID=UPI002FC7EC6C
MRDMFPNITDSISLNFINSRIVRKGRIIELVKNVKDLEAWTESPIDGNTHYNTQLSTFNSCLDNNIDINDLLEFRSELYSVLLDLLDKKISISDFKLFIEINTLNNPFSIIFIQNTPIFVPVKSGLAGIKTLMFLDLSRLVENGDINKVSKCANDSCPLIFINKNGRRKWCSMKICGNRYKVERYENKNRENE